MNKPTEPAEPVTSATEPVPSTVPCDRCGSDKDVDQWRDWYGANNALCVPCQRQLGVGPRCTRLAIVERERDAALASAESAERSDAESIAMYHRARDRAEQMEKERDDAERENAGLISEKADVIEAIGTTDGPYCGVVEGVRMLRAERDRLAAEVERLRGERDSLLELKRDLDAEMSRLATELVTARRELADFMHLYDECAQAEAVDALRWAAEQARLPHWDSMEQLADHLERGPAKG